MKWGLILTILAVFAADVRAEDKYLGAATCASSNCHGGVTPQNTTNVLQNEYVTWFRHEAHAKAWKTLTSKDSKIIAKHLGINSAENDPLCLSCHSTFVSKKLRGNKFRIEDGVSCESCHGAAENWIKSHKEKGASHAGNLRNGLKNIVSYENRAKLCMSCHLGNDEKYVDHRLISAGHPRLTFELDTFSLIQPNHWNVDGDYIKRKQNYNSTKSWLIGQAIRAEGMLSALLSEKRGSFKNMPELSNFYCYSCHHSLKDDQWKSNDYQGKPGELRINLSSVLILNQALKIIDPIVSEKLNASLDSLKENLADKNLNELKNILAKDVLTKVREFKVTKENSSELLKVLVNYGNESSHIDYEVAEQIVMGISALVATISPEKAIYKKEIDALYKATQDEEEFNAAEFRKSIVALQQASLS